MIRVGVTGAGGKMGAEVCRAVDAADDMELVAGIDPSAAGSSLRDIAGILSGVGDIAVVEAVDALDPASIDVIVDFTFLEAGRKVLGWCGANGVHGVVGTTGFTDEDLAGFADSFTNSNLLIAPNFAIGAVMMMKMAELAAPYFQTAEVIEYHHNAKKDAPSGTAMMTAQRIESAKGDSGSTWDADPTENEVVTRARGGKIGGVGVHGIRMEGMVAHQDVIFGSLGETLTIRHDSLDRKSFMPGVLLGVREIASMPGLTLGLDGLLFD